MSSRPAEIRVLHVDDDADFADLVATALERQDGAFDVETETDPTRAVERLERAAPPFDCVVTDYDMPVMDGVGLVEAVRAADADLPVILFTGKGSEEVASEAIAAGVTDYIRKRTGGEQFAVLANRIRNAVEAHRAEQEVERAEERFRKLIEETVTVIGVLDEDGDWTYVSPAVEAVTGYEPEEVVGDSGFARIHPDDEPRARAHFEALLESPGSRQRYQVRVRAKDGDWRHLDVVGRNLLDDPDVGGLLLYGYDVTERKRREEALSELHETARALMAAGSRETVLRRGIDAAEAILDFDVASFHLAEDGALVPAVSTEGTAEILGDVPALEAGESEAWTVFESREPLVTGDVRERDGVMNPDTPLRSEMILPMGEYGVFLASSTTVDSFTDADVTLAKVLVANVEAALESAEREQRLREGEHALQSLNDAMRSFVTAASEEDVLSVLVRTAEDVLRLPLVAVWRYDESERALVPAVYPDEDAIPDEPPTFHAGEGLSWEAFEAGETRRYDDLHEVAGTHNPETAVRSEIIAPIGDYGVVNSGSTTPRAFDETDRQLIDILAKTAAAALDRVQREEVLSRLHAATRDLLAADAPEGIAERTVEAARDVLGYPNTLVRLRSAETGLLEPVAASESVHRDAGSRPSYRVGEGTAGTAFERGEPVVYDLREREDDVERGVAKSLLCIPLGEHGVLSIADDEPDAFDRSARRLAGVLAANVETALDRIQKQRELERQNQRLDEFANVVSHDLRNPLNVAMSYVQMLGRDVEDERIDRVDEALGRMNDIIEDALALSRSGRSVEETERVPLAAVATAAWATAGAASAHLDIEGDPGAVLAHRGRLQQALENLFRNAREHAGRDVTVRVGRTDAGFFVEDDGPGIPEEDREIVLESGVSTSEEGTGFGLAIVERIAETHGWTLSVDEGRDGGARFSFSGVEFAEE